VSLGITPGGAGFLFCLFGGCAAMSDQIEIYENDLLFYLNEFCEVNKIEDIKKESQSVWNSALYYIQKKLFDSNYFKSKDNYNTNNKVFKESNYNSYDFELVMYVLDIYIYDMCMKYDKEVSILGFSSLTGIPDSTIYDWGKNTLSSTASEILEKLRKYQEESLSNKLVTGAKNPVGVIAILNRRYGWASPYTSDSRQQARALTANELPQLGDVNSQNIKALSGNNMVDNAK
jgi:hypothetical protein